MARTSFTGHQWMLIQFFCLGQKGQPGQTGGDTRLFLEAVLWIARTGAQWRDLPQEFGQIQFRVQTLPPLGIGWRIYAYFQCIIG